MDDSDGSISDSVTLAAIAEQARHARAASEADSKAEADAQKVDAPPGVHHHQHQH